MFRISVNLDSCHVECIHQCATLTVCVCVFAHQLDFYGALHWAVMLRVTLPLAIFHRCHSAVVLAEVWKSSYKARAD